MVQMIVFAYYLLMVICGFFFTPLMVIGGFFFLSIASIISYLKGQSRASQGSIFSKWYSNACSFVLKHLWHFVTSPLIISISAIW